LQIHVPVTFKVVKFSWINKYYT